MENLSFIDIETTGVVFGWHEIIEIGVIKTSPDAKTIDDRLEIRIKPNYPERITKKAQEINNYNEVDWENGKSHSRVTWESVIEFWKNCAPVCHNPSFERAFITLVLFDLKILETGLGYHWIGTESIAWPLYVAGKTLKLSLSSLADHFGLDQEPKPHKAIHGADLCRRVYIELIKGYSI